MPCCCLEGLALLMLAVRHVRSSAHFAHHLACHDGFLVPIGTAFLMIAGAVPELLQTGETLRTRLFTLLMQRRSAHIARRQCSRIVLCDDHVHRVGTRVCQSSKVPHVAICSRTGSLAMLADRFANRRCRGSDRRTVSHCEVDAFEFTAAYCDSPLVWQWRSDLRSCSIPCRERPALLHRRP